jgi:hypothetical protein
MPSDAARSAGGSLAHIGLRPRVGGGGGNPLAVRTVRRRVPVRRQSAAGWEARVTSKWGSSNRTRSLAVARLRAVACLSAIAADRARSSAAGR